MDRKIHVVCLPVVTFVVYQCAYGGLRWLWEICAQTTTDGEYIQVVRFLDDPGPN